MPLHPNVRRQVSRKIEEYEGRINHFYLDSVGKVTVGIGHLVATRAAVSSITMYKSSNNLAGSLATLQDKHAEYDNIVRQPKGFAASWYRRQTKLLMKNSDIDRLMDKHIDSFYRELVAIYKTSNGYPKDFDRLPQPVQIALFDMIFNLGAYRLVHLFPALNRHIKEGNWLGAAQECFRPQVGPRRNQHVSQLFSAAAREEVAA